MAAARAKSAAAMARAVGRASSSKMTLEEDPKVFIEAIKKAIAEVASRRAEGDWRRVVQALRFN
jgi:hypothetical protein